MAEGWIKLYRKFEEWEWFNKSEMVHLFIYLLINANSKDETWQGVDIKRGQLITGRKSISGKTGISERTIRTCIERLKTTNELSVKTTNKYSLITICKYDEYNSDELTKRPAKRPAKSPTNDHKQEDIDKSISLWREDFSVYLAECKAGYKAFIEDIELMKLHQRLNPGINLKLSLEKGFRTFWGTEAGWKNKKVSKTKIIDWNKTIINSIGINKVYYTKQELASMQ
jgi:hypothetical protein